MITVVSQIGILNIALLSLCRQHVEAASLQFASGTRPMLKKPLPGITVQVARLLVLSTATSAVSSFGFDSHNHVTILAPWNVAYWSHQHICTSSLLIRQINPLIFVGTSDLFWNQFVGNGFGYLFTILLPEVVIIAVAT
jgi:hypothetical protein